MIEEIIPALKPYQRLNILAAEPELTKALPNVDSKISFLPFINYLKEKYLSLTDTRADFYKYLIKKFEAEPILLKPIEDVKVLEQHADLLELLCTSLFPVVSEHEKNSFALAAPYQFRVFYYSDSFRKLFLD